MSLNPVSARVQRSLGGFASLAISLDLHDLGGSINELIQDVGQLEMVTKGDLHVHGTAEGVAPTDVKEALKCGTKFFDAVYYFAMDPAVRPTVSAPLAGLETLDNIIVKTKTRLLWTALFLMLRGSYPESTGQIRGKDIPSFLVSICAMDESPAATADGLASFQLKKINPSWIKSITWNTLAQPIRQRLALGLAGYRQLGPFRIYPCRADVDPEVKSAYDWVKLVLTKPADYDILSCTRSPALISRMGAWNKALGNLMLLCFTKEQLDEMVANKIIFSFPVRDPRADTWRNWSTGGGLALESPIGL